MYPLVELLPEYTNFLRFIMQAPSNQPLADIMWNLDDEHGSGSRRLARHLLDAMDHLPLAIRVSRLRAGFQLLLQAVSTYATQQQDGVEGLLPSEVFYADMINAVTAFLLAERARDRDHGGRRGRGSVDSVGDEHVVFALVRHGGDER